MNCRIIASKKLVSGFFAVGLVTATVLAGCSSSSSNNSGSSGGTAGKDAGAAGKGGSTGVAGQPAGGTTAASGGIAGQDAGTAGSGGTPDAAATGGRTGTDAAAGGTGGAGGSAGAAGPDAALPDAAQPDAGRSDTVADAPLDTPADVPLAGDTAQQLDASGSDGSSSDGSSAAGCQRPTWAEQFDPNVSALNGLALDKSGNIFVAGTSYSDPKTGTLNLGAAGTIPSKAGANLLVARFDPTTGSFVWAKVFGDDEDQFATGVAVDKSGRVAVVGQFQGNITFGTAALANTGGTLFAFIGALDSSGTALWGKSVDLGNGQLSAIAAHPNFDDFVVCGYATNSATDLVTGASTNSDGMNDIVVAKIKGADGSVIWARQLGGAGDQSCNVVAVADDGNVFVAGGYAGTLDLGPGAFPAPSGVSVILPWVAKLDGASGSTLFATSFGTAATKGMHVIQSIAADGSGNVVVGGQFNRAITYGSITLTPAGLTDALAAKLDPNLNVLWAKSWGDTDDQAVSAVAFDSAGDVTIVGTFKSKLDFGLGGLLTSSGGNDAFIAQLAGASGVAKCAARYGDQLGAQEFSTLGIARFAVGAQKDVAFLSGDSSFEIDFGIPSQNPLQTNGARQLFLLRLDRP